MWMLAVLLPLGMRAQDAAPVRDDSAPTFVVPQAQLPQHLKIIAYGDQRFHDPKDPKNPSIADPVMRLALVNKIAEEKPDAVMMSGDVPYNGNNPADYDNYVTETAPCRSSSWTATAT
jgi:hypothetical protein